MGLATASARQLHAAQGPSGKGIPEGSKRTGESEGSTAAAAMCPEALSLSALLASVESGGLGVLSQ